MILLSMFHAVFFPFFLFRLVIVTTPTLLGFAQLRLKPWQSLSYSLISLILAMAITTQLSPLLLTPKNNSNTPLPSLFKPDHKQVEKLLSGYLELYQLQPTDRDVLVNIAQLYEILDQPESAQEFWTAAKKTDPNHSRFSQK